ncbi:MAG: SPOR domain-containing protein [Bacteroidia bacterium]
MIASDTRFFSGSYEQLKEQARVENKPFFICFYKEDCQSSQKMNDITFNDEEVANYIARNYLAYRVDCYSFDGFDLAAKFGVYHFPNVTIFTPQGKPIYEIEGYQEPETMIGNLQTEAHNMKQPGFCPGKCAHYQAKPKTQMEIAKVEYPAGFKFDVPIAHAQEGFNAPVSQPVEKPTVVERPLVDRYAQSATPSFSPPKQEPIEKVAAARPKYSDVPTVRSLMPTTTPKAASPKPAKTTPPKEIVTAKVERKMPKYAVQVGAFKDMTFAQQMVNSYKEKGEAQVQLKQITQDGENIYKIVVGVFNSRNDATDKLETLKNEGVEGFIISL